MVLLIIMWFIGCAVVSVIGEDRKIGSGLSLLYSFLFTPILGLIITLNSQRL